MKDWQALQPKSTPPPLTREEEFHHTQNLREIIHYTYDGVSCADCGIVLSLYPASPFLPESAIVMLDKDPRATWVTTLRKPNCLKR